MNSISSLSGNAILAKSRAMYGNCLNNEDYTQLLNCRTINELVAYLKNHTVYSNALVSASDVNFTRSRVEARIRQYNYTRIAGLASFESAIGQKLNEIIFMSFEISIILSCADHLDSASVSDKSLFAPQTILNHLSFDPIELEKATDFTTFYNALSLTRYKKALDIFVNGTAVFSIQALENALYRYVCAETRNIIKKNFSGDDTKEILSVFKMKSDFKMIESIYRMKKYFPDEPLDLTKVFYSGLSAFSNKEIHEFINAGSAESLFDMLKGTLYGKYLDEKYKNQIEKCTHIAQQQINETKMRFSTIPEVVMFSFIGILENEAKNIVHIIEGVRYSLSSDEIAQFLVFSKTA